MPTLPLHLRKLAAVGYVPFIGPIVIYGHRTTPFIYFHAAQGTVLSLYLIVAYFLPAVGPYIALIFAGLMAAGFIHAVHGQMYRVPIIGDLIAWLVKKGARGEGRETR